MNLLKPYLNLGPDRPKWAILADSIIAKHCIKTPKRQEDALINTFLQNWNTNVTSLLDILKHMVGNSEKYGFIFKDVKPLKEIREAMPIWYHPTEDHGKKHISNTKAAHCLCSNHKVVLAKDAMQMASHLSNKEHKAERACRCNQCEEDRSIHNCRNPHECATLAMRKLNSLLKKWDPRIEDTPDPEENMASNNNKLDGETFCLRLPKSITELKHGFRVLTSYTDHDTVQNPTVNPPGKLISDLPITAFIASETLEERRDNACTGAGIVFKNFLTRSKAMRLPQDLPQTRYSRVLAMLLIAIQTAPQNVSLTIFLDSNQTAKTLTTRLETWEDKGFIGMENRCLLQAIAAQIRGHIEPTYLKLSQNTEDPLLVHEAHELATEGCKKKSTDKIDWSTPEETRRPGVKLSSLTQGLAYRAITELQTMPKVLARKTTAANVKRIKTAITEINRSPPTSKDIWTGIRKEAFNRRVKNFMFLMVHGAQRTGGYWKHIPGCEERQNCKHCGEEESMEHILTECPSSVQNTIWKLARALLESKDNSQWPPINFETIMGVGSIKIYASGRKVDKGKTRLFRLIVTESAHLIWTTRCKIIVREEAIPTEAHLTNAWAQVINERLGEDRRLTNPYIFKMKALDKALVLETWRGTLKDENLLPKDWICGPKVLVGIGNQITDLPAMAEDEGSIVSDNESLLLDHG
ncbi:hypothetical protein C8J56DRAFT_888910 [Mycena floridula]|nr:hypothetical protein C8J56DRAFT_888910 [Mycena floridula]